MRHAQPSRLLFIAVVFLTGLALPPAQAQQVSTSWNGGTGNWSASTDWTPTAVPNNGGGTTYSVTINVPGSVVTMDVLNDTVDNLILGNGFNGVNTLIINAGDSLTVLSDLGTSGPEGGGTTYSQLINNGTLTVAGEVGHSGVLTNNGVFVYSGTSFESEGPITNTAGASFINSGNIHLTSLGSPLSNAGSFINTSGADFSAFGETITNAAGASIVNSGTFSVEATTVNNYGVVSNRGSLILSISNINNSGTILNAGTLSNNASIMYNFSGATLINYGTLNNTSNSPCCLGPVPSALENSGTFINSGGTLNNDSLSTVTNSGTLLNISFANLSNAGTLNNTGGTLFIDSTSNLINSGTLNNSGTINNSGTFTNSGAVAISSTGIFITSTNYTQTTGSTAVDGTLTATGSAIVNIQGGTLGGDGTINGNVLMGGTLMPGDAPGTLTILGNYEQTGTGIFDEIISGKSQSFLDVSGNVTLDPGSLLEITLLNGYDPLNQTFSIMDFASLNGQFANGASFWDDGFLWDVTYRQHEVDVTAVEAPEPSSLLLLFFGLVAVAFVAHRKMGKSHLA